MANVDPKSLAAENEALKAKLAQYEPPPPGEPLPEKYRGEKQYIVGPARAYQNGRLYLEGEVITLVDQVPNPSFIPLEEEAPAPRKAQPQQQAQGINRNL